MGRLFLAMGFGAALLLFFADGRAGDLSAGWLSSVVHEGVSRVISVKNQVFRELG